MLSFKDRKRGNRGGWGRGIAAVAAVAAVATVGALLPANRTAHADTVGGWPANGNEVLFFLVDIGGIFNFDGPPRTLVDLTGAIYGYVRNEYIGVSLGTSGSFTVNYGDPGLGSVTYNVPGRLSFGNREGSLLRTDDNNAPLNGFGFGLSGTPPYPVWPLGTSVSVPARFYYDYSAYVAMRIDNVPKNLGFTDTDFIVTRFVDNKLVTEYQALDNRLVTVRSTIDLVRSKARLRWDITNNDNVVHTVGLRFTVNNMQSRTFDPVTQQIISEAFFVDPTVGQTNRSQLYQGGNVPARIDVVRGRASLLAPSPDNPPLHAQHLLRGFDATPPDRVLVVDSEYFYPGGPYDPDPNDPNFVAFFEDGISTGVYWDDRPLQPGETRTLVTYYGNGSATENLTNAFNNLSYATGTEALEAVAFNTAGVDDPVLQQNKSGATLENSSAFYTPRTLTVFGSLYNRTLSEPQFQVPITGVNMTLTLPEGLKFGVPDPRNGAPDVAAKAVGDVPADTDAQQSWVVEPTGTVYGPLTYSLTIQTANAGSSTLTRTIHVPATPLKRVTANNFQMISFPFEFDAIQANGGDPNTVINGLTRPEDTNTIFQRWIPDPQSLTGEGRYQRAERLEPGVSYFYRPSFDRTIFANGVFPVLNQAPPRGAGTTKVIPIQRGWNMIGNPYLYDIPLNYLQLIRPENLLQVYSFTEGVQAGLVKGGVFTFNPNTGLYDFFENFADPIRPWEGYWVFADADLLLKYLAPTQLNAAVIGPVPNDPNNPGGGVTRLKPRTIMGAIASRAALVAQPTMDEWKLQIVARNKSGRIDGATLVGQSRSAKDTDDLRDLPKPPVPHSNYIYVGITRAGAATRYAQDLRAPGGKKTWELEVRADQDGPITFSWPNMATLPRRLRLTLKDTATGRVTNLKSTSSITLNVSANTPRRFQVTSQPMTSQPLTISNPRVAPATRGGRGYTFLFGLNQPATVNGRVLTMGGKAAVTFAVGRAATVGENRLVWDGRTLDGAALPAGPYLIEISARTDEGEPVTQKLPLTMIR